MITNYTQTYLNSLATTIDENRKKLELPNDMGIEKVFLEEKSYENRLKNKREEKEGEAKFPFLLIRPSRGRQKYKNGFYSKTQKYLIRIGIKEENMEKGYTEISHIADRIVSFFTKNPLATRKKEGYNYHVNLDEIITELNLELTAGDYWTWDILIDLDVPSL